MRRISCKSRWYVESANFFPAGGAQRLHQGQRGGHGRGGAAQPGQREAEGQGRSHDAQIQGHPQPLGLQQPERRRAEMDGQQQDPAARAEQEHDVLRRVGPAQRLAEDEVGAVAGPRQQRQEQGGCAGVLAAAQIEQHEPGQGQARGRVPDAGRAFAQDDAGQDGGHDGREADGRHRAHGDARLLDAPEEKDLEAQQAQRGGDEPAQLPVPQPRGQGMPAGAPGPEGQRPDLHAQGPDAQRMAAIRGQGLHGAGGAEAQGAEDDAQRAAGQQGRAAGEPPGAR